MERINKKGILKLIFKVSVSGLAMYVVIRKIDLIQTRDILLQAGSGWLILAFLAFNLSKFISSIRLNEFFKSINLHLSVVYNLKLYYVGMFYNLFLPGGIGGDGYKVYLLHRSHNTSVRQLVSATLLDRISGLMALIFLALFLGFFIDLSFVASWAGWALAGILVFIYPGYYLFFRLIFKNFKEVFNRSSMLSFLVQLAQILSAFLLLKALHVPELYLEYMTLFLLSSIVAVIPFTIGGIGARELVFIFGSDYLLIDKNTAVVFSVLFFVVTAISSFAGIFLETGLKTERA